MHQPLLALLQVNIGATCFGLHTCLVFADLAGITFTSCSINSWLRIRCSLLFWAWDKPDGHLLGCKYFESLFTLFLTLLAAIEILFDQIMTSNNGSLWWVTTWIYRRISNNIWPHMHLIIIRRCIIARMRLKPWSNRFTKWIWRRVWFRIN